MKGTFVNIITVIVGSFIGILIGTKFPENIKKIAFDGVGLSSLALGIMLALKTDNIIIMVFSILFGAIIGELLKIEEFLENFGDKIKNKVKAKSSFTEGFITATLIFCVGSMAIIGSINEGLTGDATILYTKSILDGITSIALSSTLGIGVMFSTLPILIYQGGITLFSSTIKNLFTTHAINMITGVGGVLIIGIGLNLLGIKKIKLANFLPALIIAFILSIFIK
ncbi:MAG TPA: DUF554 domain-containing protein [Caldisericia bacterium]|nr:DUF554 domain-containing protein [Caldisericia bacterium]HOL83213.1 DUF554 domain-containing protein [Caldisericia bacterium]HPC57057.1 DUF554 domain-containing protein [Caldisericia bacterium]HPP43745.1 DUF554 domain-containing protein [Caldisericia bacterium]